MRHEQHLPAVMKREWLLVNGMGGYAMGDDNSACTRTRHHLLVAPVRPPLQRAAFVRTLTETILTDNGWLPLREMCRLHYENRRGLPVFVYESNHFTLLKHLGRRITFTACLSGMSCSAANCPWKYASCLVSIFATSKPKRR